MSIQTSSAIASLAANSSPTANSADKLGKDDFLMLLVAQLKNQDPMSPVGDKEFISQIAQFNTLEQMQNLNTKFMEMLQWQQISQSSSMIGKKVDALNSRGEVVSGVVTEVRISSDGPLLKVNGENVSLGNISRIY